jgi:hypothetical protein
MDLTPPEPSKLDVRARRARALIFVLTAVLMAAPLVMYVLAGSAFGPRR